MIERRASCGSQCELKPKPKPKPKPKLKLKLTSILGQANKRTIALNFRVWAEQRGDEVLAGRARRVTQILLTALGTAKWY